MQVQKNFQRFEKHGVQVLVVSFSKRELFEPFAKDHAHSHFTFLRDPECKAYKAFGLRRAKITEMLKPTVAIKYFSLILKGGKVKKTQEDVYQLGGDFILDPQGKVIFSYPSQHPDDRPSIQELLSVLDQ